MTRKNHVWCAWMFCAILTANAQSPDVGAAAQTTASGIVAGALAQGQEDQIKSVTEPARARRRAPKVPAQDALADALKPIEGINAAEATIAAGDADKSVNIVRVTGDWKWFEDTGLMAELKSKMLDTPSSIADIDVAIGEVQKSATAAKGYYLASIKKSSYDAESKVLTLAVNSGKIGARSVTFVRKDKSGEIVESDTGRYFSREQIERKLNDTNDGDVFNYNDFYERFYELNAHPDLTANVALRIPEDVKDDARTLDVDFRIEEKLPIHAVVDIDNYGTDAVDNWMGRLTLQHLNLTKADDVLTFNAQTALDFGSIYGLAASYYRPHHFWKGGAFTVHGGYTEVDADDVVPYIDVEGNGWFAGAQASFKLVDTRDSLLTGSFGFVRRYVEDNLVVAGTRTVANDVTINPFSLALMYADKKLDALNGRNYITLEGVLNFGDFLGSSDDREIQSQRVAAEADYFILRAQAARIQMLNLDKNATGNWMLFAKVDAQVSDGALVSAEQMGIGGANSVRGYKEREFMGDHAVAGTLELRTPIYLGAWTKLYAKMNSGYKPDINKTPVDRMQFVTFFDVGHISIEDALPGERDSKTLYSLGLGVRLALTERAQLKFDWGFPLEETNDSSHGGYGHLNFQMQF